MVDSTLLGVRIRQSEDGRPPRSARPTLWGTATTIGGLAVWAWALAGSAALVAAAPLDGASWIR
ncbi:hypothetical protein ACFXPY_18270 [Streptomyces sp. NPDC059153]|uniref:hypothetical protein n=1 Tax=Streptomyces sp. NPDC059153 TaxID=3346743 RepID=UPI00368F8596